jgi:predicted O-methyltransferase YrrM
MFTKFQLVKKYLKYYFTALNGKGHGIHSPFVYDFIKNVLNDKREYECCHQIEQRRKSLLADKTVIEVEDFGAGSGVIKTNRRIIKNIAQSSLKPKKYAQLLYRMVNYYQPEKIIELGTSFGITTSYLATGNIKATLYTFEGAKNIAAIASQTFTDLNLKNITLIEGNFETTLPTQLSQIKNIDFAFIDGNHLKQPTLNYFSQLLSSSGSSTILVFDDIHWSAEMEQAWAEIQQHPAVTLTIDLFFMGIVCIKKEFKAKQHFVIRF